MRHEERPKTLADAVHAASFAVYGLAHRPLGLTVSSYGVGIPHLGNFISVSLLFTSPLYSDTHPYYHYTPKSKNFQIISLDAAVQHPTREHMIFDLESSFESQLFQNAAKIIEEHRFTEEAKKMAGSPSIWKGTLLIGDTVFSGKRLYWESPLRVSTFCLKSETTILLGDAYGPSDKDLIRLLEGLQVINQRDDLLKQYQYEMKSVG